jgi:hypothetical protein
VNVTRFNGPSWSQTLSLDWLAWDAAGAAQLPTNMTDGSITVAASGSNIVERFTVTLARALPVLDPIVVVSVGSPSHTVAATVVATTPTTFEVNIACAHCVFKAGDVLHVSWLAFVREFFGASVTSAPLVGTKTVVGPLVQEVWQPFRPKYAAQTLRLYRDAPTNDDVAHVEIISDIGPLDAGRELVTRFDTSLVTALSATTGVFYTDDNGLEVQARPC